MRAISSLAVFAAVLSLGCESTDPADEVFGLGVEVPEPAYALESSALAAAPDLGVHLSGPSSAPTGSTQTYNVVARNWGTLSSGAPALNNVDVTFNLPAGTTLVSASGGCAASANPLVVKCAWPSIAPGAYQLGVVTVVEAATSGQRTFSASGFASSAETNFSNNLTSLKTALYVVIPPVPVTIALPQLLRVTSCYGSSTTSLITSYADCASPWIRGGLMTLNADLSMLTGSATVAGAWSQPLGASSIEMVFRNATSGALVSTFTGSGVSASCFQGTVLSATGLRGAFQACVP